MKRHTSRPIEKYDAIGYVIHVVGLGFHEGRELTEEHSEELIFLSDMRLRRCTCNTQNLGGTGKTLGAK